MIEFTTPTFDEAIKFFRDKTPLTPDLYRKLTDEAKAKAFTVSGITRMDIVRDIYAAMDKAIAEKTTFADFKKSLKEAEALRGWRGQAPYRLDTIFRTNVQQAFQAGHYQQLMQVTGTRLYWQYSAVMDGRTRPAHAAMNGKVAAHDDPFWKVNFPPNGFNCRCTVVSVSKSEIERDGLTPEKHMPDIADTGFRNNPGEVSYRDILAERAIDGAKKERYQSLIEKGAKEAGRPDKVPYDPMPAKLGPVLKELGGDMGKAEILFQKAIGGKSVAINTPDGDSIIMSDYLLKHLTMDGREAYFPLIRPTLENPYEIWLSPEKGETTGRIVMRKRFIRFFEDEKKRHVMLVAEYQQGSFVGYTFFRGDKVKYFADQRRGWLLYGR